MKRVFLYARSARDEDMALERQMGQLKAFAAQEGYEVVGAAQDIGSGLTLDHKGLGEIKSLASEGEIDAVLVTNIYRISRKTSYLTKFQRVLLQYDVTINALDGTDSGLVDLVDIMDWLNNSSQQKATKKDTTFGNEVSNDSGIGVLV